MNEEQIKDMILKQCLELTTNNDFRPPISAYDGVDIDDVVRTCKQLQDKKTYLDLVKENQELKKQLEEKNKPQIFIDTQDIEERYAEGLYQDYLEEENKKYKTQQKEFIEYMNKTIEELQCDDVDDEEMKGYLIQRIDTFKEILSKFKNN